MRRISNKTAYRKPERAFTLIELLVVVSIIALLVSILLPALGKAREQAKRVLCAGHLNSIGQLIYIYAEQKDGYLPFPLYNGLSAGDLGSPSRTYMIADVDTAISVEARMEAANNLHRVYNLGNLWMTNDLDNHELYYCPSAKNTPFCLERYTMDDKWPNGMPVPPDENPGTEGRIRCSYSYLPQSKGDQVKIDGQKFASTAFKIAKLSPGLSMSLDILQQYGRFSHFQNGQAGVNVLFSDASVQFRSNPDVLGEEHYTFYGKDPMISNSFWRSLIRDLEQ